MTDFGLANMDYAPVKFMIKCFEANYPESLGAVLIHKAPWVFQGIWKVIKGWLDPVVASKVHFTNNLDDMSVFLESSSIIKELGGSKEWSYKYPEPIEGENDIMKDEATKSSLISRRKELSTQYEDLVNEWIAADQPAFEKLRQRRDDLADEIRHNYWKLDPFVRARSLYDRSGELKPDAAPTNVPEVTPAAPAA
jgi:hypothetical protein